MHSASSPSLVPAASSRTPQFLRLSAPLESEKRNFLVLTSKITAAPVTDEQKVGVDSVDGADEVRPRSESVASTSSDVSSSANINGIQLQRWVSNIDIPEEATF
ncbi:hypothetical protein V1509DRAFT_628521 [Lipomyces kononenkoae]